MNIALHQQRARRAWPILIRTARTRERLLTYGQIGAMIGVHHRVCSYFLGMIQNHCRNAGIPALQVLVVNARTGLPGAGFTACRRTPGAIAETTRKVRNYFWKNESNPF